MHIPPTSPFGKNLKSQQELKLFLTIAELQLSI